MSRALAVAFAVALVAVSLPAAAGGDDGVQVQVRIEGPPDAGTIWSGNVTLSGTYQLTATTSGETYTLDARTPLGALDAAAGEGSFDVRVSDDFASSDFTVDAVDGHRSDGVYWWDYRVEWVKTYYGNQRGWLEHGPGLQDGDRILWYLETTASRPLRLSADGAAAQGDGAAAFRIEWPAGDPSHRPGKPWPTLVWTPAHATRLVGDIQAPAPAGAAVVPLEEGTYRTKAVADDDGWPVPTVRSNPVTVVVE